MFIRTAVLAALLCAAFPAGAFDYGGLSLETEAHRLRELFPVSAHEFRQRGTGAILLPDDEEGRFEEVVRTGDGSYVVRLAPEDTRAEVTSLRLSLDQGRTSRMTLGLERDSKGFTPEAIERRFPGCRAVLDALVARYGQPAGFVSRAEEGLEWRVRSWKGPEGVMRLECGRFPGREAIFAIEVEIEAPGGAPGPAAPVGAVPAAAPAVTSAPKPAPEPAAPKPRPAEPSAKAPPAKAAPKVDPRRKP